MKRTIMSYMVATIVSLAAIGGLMLQPLPQMAQAQPAPTATVTNPVCGEVVRGVVNLTSSLVCDGDGIIVGSDNTVINLNGYSIKNSSPKGTESSKVGIMIPNNDNVVVKGPGTISNFQAGILVTGANHLSIGPAVTLLANQIGVFMTGADNAQLTHNLFIQNNLGFATHSSTGADIESNIFTGNTLAGITLVNTHNAQLVFNNVAGSQNGIFLDAQSSNNVVKTNDVLNNAIDMNNANGLAANINANSFTENNCRTSNPSGICIGR